MQRSFLFLQGPHGPFFAQLARRLDCLGHKVTRVGFNAGDRAFWPRRLPYHPFRGSGTEWPQAFETLLVATQATDLVLYGDTRSIHAEAAKIARAKGLRLHIFEEGYLRPHWITYERDGANANSPLMHMDGTEIEAALGPDHADAPMPPAKWGALRAHIFYGALYHFCGLALRWRYPALAPHREIPLHREARLYLKLLSLMLPHWLDRVVATRRVMRSGNPYALVLLQLAHDANFRDHGPFAQMQDFVAEVIEGFAKAAPHHHHLVFKAHPLEDGRVPIRADIKKLARHYQVADRVHFVGGGKLAHLLDTATSAITVNSTAAHQALWRGLPVKAFGGAIYSGRGFTTDQSLVQFFQFPQAPEMESYSRFRGFLLATSQIPGSYYSAKGRRQVFRRIIDLLEATGGPYDALKRDKSDTGPRLFVATEATR